MNLRALPPANLRIAALFALALGMSALLFMLIEAFAFTLVMAAVLAGIAQPVYQRLLKLFGGRQGAASASTVVLTLVLIIGPLLVLLGIVLGGALEVSASASQWVKDQAPRLGTMHEKVASFPLVKRLLPYEDAILQKAGELAGAAAGFVAAQVGASARGSVQFVLMLFVTLYAMYYFLMHGHALVDTTLCHTPLTPGDRQRLIDTFMNVAKATLKGTLMIGILQGGLAGLSFWAAGIPAAMFWSTIMMVLSVIPGIGAALVWVPAVIMLAVGGHFTAAIGVALWCLLVVGTVDNVLRPILVGKSAEMPGLLVLLTTMGGLVVFGVMGLVIGPVIGALFVTVWQMWGTAVAETRPGPASPEPRSD